MHPTLNAESWKWTVTLSKGPTFPPGKNPGLPKAYIYSILHKEEGGKYVIMGLQPHTPFLSSSVDACLKR